MKRSSVISAISGLVFLLTFIAAPVRAATMGSSGGYDIDDLWARAQSSFDLTADDALLLLESKHVSVLDGGDMLTRVHRVVWIGTGAVIRTHADLRIPYNSAHSELKVLRLRTWRDNQWWPHAEEISPTAVVETLPYAVALADDYSTMRETMLLHDGVELPCIMETSYEILERSGAEHGTDGLWVFSQRDPAVLVEFSVSVPEQETFVFESANEAPEPAITSDSGRKTFTWTLENVEKLGVPLAAHPAAQNPHVAWSTWPDWRSLGDVIVTSFNEAAEASDALADTVARRIAETSSPVSTARAIAAYVNECTRSIHYDPGFWPFAPRPASRTWETAYGHGLDRAVLAAALFKDAGLEAGLFYKSAGSGEFGAKVPGLSRFENLQLWVAGDNFQAIYDPENGTFTEGKIPLLGRAVWKPSSGVAPSTPPDLKSSRIEVMLNVEPEKDKGWKGTGQLSAGGLFCPYGEMKGLEDESLVYVKRVAGSVLNGAEVSGFNPENFSDDLVTVGFQFSAKAGEPDETGRTRVYFGSPAGGILSLLPSDVSLYHEFRESPVQLPGLMTQRIRARIKTGKHEIVYLPEAREIKNEAGSYSLDVVQKDGWITIDQTITLDSPFVTPEAWPQLRLLLLEVEDVSGRMILLK